MSDLIDDPTGKFLKVKLIQKKGKTVAPAYFFDEGAKVEWNPNPSKLTTNAPGVKIASYDDEWFGARCGKRHWSLPDCLLLQDPRGLRDARQVSSVGGAAPMTLDLVATWTDGDGLSGRATGCAWGCGRAVRVKTEEATSPAQGATCRHCRAAVRVVGAADA